jgi:hypothetical protein
MGFAVNRRPPNENSFSPITPEQRKRWEDQIIGAIIGAAATAASQQQNGLPYPKYLQMTGDKYIYWEASLRGVTYQLSYTNDNLLYTGVITEHLMQSPPLQISIEGWNYVSTTVATTTFPPCYSYVPIL